MHRAEAEGIGSALATRSIRSLPEQVVNQIAAGEVVERPASVVRELLDNAIDAGARSVTVELERGGIELVRVSDDGVGVAPDELPLAIAPHATSKIEDAEDLVSIQTMGFRGEALSAIASVSRMTIRSRPRDADGACELRVEGGRMSEVHPAAGPAGTSVEVRNLFFNTPARRRFLRTPQTEQGHCVETVRCATIGRPEIGFRLVVDGRTSLDVPPGQSRSQRVLDVLGAEMAGDAIEVHAGDDLEASPVAVWGLIGRPAAARATTRAQRLFINRRLVRDRTLQHALQEAYRGLIDPSRRPAAVLLVDVDPSLVDVNVHPAKAEVRFRDQGAVHSAALRALREALRREDLTPSWSGGAAREHTEQDANGAGWSASALADRLRALAPGETFDYEQLRSAVARDDQASESTAPPGPDPEPSARMAAPRAAPRILQVHDSFLVTEDDDGMVIIDQHALHERVMFEKIMDRLRAGALQSQRLLTPVTVRTTPARLEALDELRGLLARLGVEASPIGPDAAAVHAFPTLLFDRRVDPAEFLGDLLERAEREGVSSGEEAAIHAVVDMMACKAAVKAGDRLGEEELAELLALRERVDRSTACPHGRPTTIRLSMRDLERQFGRR